MKAVNDLGFLSSYRKELNRIRESILNELPKEVNTSIGKKVKGCVYLKTMNYSEIGDSWGGFDSSYSKSLDALSRKIAHMIDRGWADSVEPMLISICSNNIKKMTKRSGGKFEEGEHLGYGHFRWDNRAITLTKDEIEKVKDFFKISINQKNIKL